MTYICLYISVLYAIKLLTGVTNGVDNDDGNVIGKSPHVVIWMRTDIVAVDTSTTRIKIDWAKDNCHLTSWGAAGNPAVSSRN